MKSAEGRRPSALNRAYSSVPELYDTPPSPATLRRLVLSWYRGSGRELPWRRTRDPYRVLVSEVMLQQTQVSRVLPAYRRFLRRFPTLRALSRAPLGEVLREWSGLGYNRRARDLHRIARTHTSGLPRTVADLDALPGIGAYTSAAVARARRAFPLEAAERAVASRIDGYRSDDLHREGAAMRRVSDPRCLRLRRHRNATAAKTVALRGERPPHPRRDRPPARGVHPRCEGRDASKRYQGRARTASRKGARPRGSRGGFIRERSSSGALT